MGKLGRLFGRFQRGDGDSNGKASPHANAAAAETSTIEGVSPPAGDPPTPEQLMASGSSELFPSLTPDAARLPSQQSASRLRRGQRPRERVDPNYRPPPRYISPPSRPPPKAAPPPSLPLPELSAPNPPAPPPPLDDFLRELRLWIRNLGAAAMDVDRALAEAEREKLALAAGEQLPELRWAHAELEGVQARLEALQAQVHPMVTAARGLEEVQAFAMGDLPPLLSEAEALRDAVLRDLLEALAFEGLDPNHPLGLEASEARAQGAQPGGKGEDLLELVRASIKDAQLVRPFPMLEPEVEPEEVAQVAEIEVVQEAETEVARVAETEAVQGTEPEPIKELESLKEPELVKEPSPEPVEAFSPVKAPLPAKAPIPVEALSPVKTPSSVRFPSPAKAPSPVQESSPRPSPSQSPPPSPRAPPPLVPVLEPATPSPTPAEAKPSLTPPEETLSELRRAAPPLAQRRPRARRPRVAPAPVDAIVRMPRIVSLHSELGEPGVVSRLVGWPREAEDLGARRRRRLLAEEQAGDQRGEGPEARWAPAWEARVPTLAPLVRGATFESMGDLAEWVSSFQADHGPVPVREKASAAGPLKPAASPIKSSAPAPGNWPTERWAALAEAAALHDALVAGIAALQSWRVDPGEPFEAECLRLSAEVTALGAVTGKASHAAGPLRARMARQRLPWDESLLRDARWAAQEAVCRALEAAQGTLERARAMKKKGGWSVGQVLRPLGHAVKAAFAVHQFAGGLANKPTALASELVTETVHFARMADPQWLRHFKLGA